MTQRRRLDAFLAEQAAAAGADFRDGVTVEGLAVGPDGASLRVGGSAVHGRVLVGADGVNGRIARDAGLGGGIALRRSRSRATGRCWTVRRAARRSSSASSPAATAGSSRRRDHANYGVGGWAAEGPRLREHLRRLCAVHGVDDTRLTDLRGHRLPIRRTTTAARGPRRCSSATRPAWSTRSRATGSTRRSSRRGSRRRRSSTASPARYENDLHAALGRSPPRPGRRSSCSTGTRAQRSGSRGSRRVARRGGLLRARSLTRARRGDRAAAAAAARRAC